MVLLSLGKFSPNCEKGRNTEETYKTTLGQEASPSRPRGGSLNKCNSAKGGRLHMNLEASSIVNLVAVYKRWVVEGLNAKQWADGVKTNYTIKLPLEF